jgi:hypothetical protein
MRGSNHIRCSEIIELQAESAKRVKRSQARAGVLKMKKRNLSRKEIVQKLVETLEQLDYVHACWESGASAFNRVDEWSDIDLNAVVEDERVTETFSATEDALKSISPITEKLEIAQLPWPGVSQAFYKLKNASDYLLIDFAVFKLNSPDKLLEPEIHGNAVFHFNKSGKVKIPHVDRRELRSKLQKRLERLKTRFELFNVFVQKEINRGNFLEAIDLYHNFTLAMLVEALRIRDNPLHCEFRMRYVHYELASEIIERLSLLYFVKDQRDLQRKYREATMWLAETIVEIEGEDYRN